MLQKISSVFVVYRRKTLTGSPDPTHAIGTDKHCRDVIYINKRSKATLNRAMLLMLEMLEM